MLDLRDEPLSRHGYWRIGGPADRLVVVETDAELAEVLPEATLILGSGSNLLPPDEGIRGTVVRLGGRFRELEVLGRGEVRAGAGLPNSVLLQRLGRLGLGGAGMLAGVPGTVGGAVAMNAGTALGEIADVLVAVEGVGPGGPATIARADLAMTYREGGLPEGFVVTAAVLRLSSEGVAEEQARVAAHLQRRRETQPLDLPSCGSVFRNPPGDHAGRLVESVGLKGWRSGDAEISRRHANFIVNLGAARAEDVMACILTAWRTVAARTGVRLVPEVRVVGRWPADVWPPGLPPSVPPSVPPGVGSHVMKPPL